MPRLFYDVATTRFYSDRNTGAQPEVLRVAWCREGDAEPECHLVVPPPNSTADPKALLFHGVSVDEATRCGVTPALLLDAFADALNEAGGQSAAFNAEFHTRNLNRLADSCLQPTLIDNSICVMKLATPIVKIESMRPGGGYAYPSLAKACESLNLPLPLPLSDSIARGKGVVMAVRRVFEACVALTR
jgi:hypothetical protein